MSKPGGSFAYLWIWGLWQVEAFFRRLDYRQMLVNNGVGL